MMKMIFNGLFTNARNSFTFMPNEPKDNPQLSPNFSQDRVTNHYTNQFSTRSQIEFNSIISLNGVTQRTIERVCIV